MLTLTWKPNKTIEWNHQHWNRKYDLSESGEEWPTAWDGTEAQWRTCIFPRLCRFLPAGSQLEITPGFGCWTGYLLQNCGAYLGVDLRDRCVAACEKRYADVRVKNRCTYAAARSSAAAARVFL